MICVASPMIKAIDTNILLDILIPNSAYLTSSLDCLLNVDKEDELIISSIVFAELGTQFLSFDDLVGFLKQTGIKMIPLNEKSLFEASKAWKTYTANRKDEIFCPSCGNKHNIICPSCGETISFRQHILSDFLIGAHAKMQAEQLITRDRGFYRKYFQGINILQPTK